MTVNLHFEDAYPSIFQTAVSAFKLKAKDISSSILMALIVSVKNQNKELSQILVKIEQDNNILASIDLIEFYDTMNILQDNLELLLDLANKHKSKSDIFMEFYKAIDELYNSCIVITVDIGFIESDLKYTENLQDAS